MLLIRERKKREGNILNEGSDLTLNSDNNICAHEEMTQGIKGKKIFFKVSVVIVNSNGAIIQEKENNASKLATR